MIKRKVLFVFGTRPEAIKMAPVIDAFHKQSNLFEVIVCSTGQHKEMLDQVINFFKIKVDYKIKVMRPNQNLSGLSSKILLKIIELAVFISLMFLKKLIFLLVESLELIFS